MIVQAETTPLIETATSPHIETGSRRYIGRELRRFAKQARGRRLRSRVEFAKDCIVLPEGPYANYHWRPHFQPYTFHVLKLMDEAGYRRFRFSGCVQSGKTFIVVINVCWHLFERRETTIYGVPDVNLTGGDKWREELLPTINASPWMRQFLPTRGLGSRGGTPAAIEFRNGATLRFMGATGGDHRRSHYTAPVVVKTEVDRYDEATESSRETTPVEQMEARTEAFGDRAFSYEECTMTTVAGRINSELEQSTNTRLHVNCVDCRRLVYPTREDLIGVEDAPDVNAAGREGAFKCPSCGILWSEEDRRRMVTIEGLTPVHEGQDITAGDNGQPIISGQARQTDRLGVTWHAFHNLFWTTEKICRDEYKAIFSKHPDEADLARRQFAWCLPAEPEEFDVTPLTVAQLSDCVNEYPPREVPPQTRWLSAAADVNKRELHFVVRAWTDVEGLVSGHAIDIGTIPVPSEALGVRKALLQTLLQFRDERILAGYADRDGNRYVPTWTLIDAGWMEQIIWLFIVQCAKEEIRGFMPILGRGQSEPPGKGSYVQPKNISDKIPWIGEQCYIRKSEKYATLFHQHGVHAPPYFVLANSDQWKTFVREGYSTPRGQPGRLDTFKETTTEERKLLMDYRRQTAAEKVVRKVVPRRGAVDVYVNESKKRNHLGDADYYSCIAGHVAGVRIEPKTPLPTPATPPAPGPITMPDGRPITQM